MKLSKSLSVLVALLLPCLAEAQDIERRDTLTEARISTEVSRHESFTQTGLTRIDGKKFRSGYSVFSTPDLIKTIQALPGVAAGTELMSGLYVHGGDGTDNLFLLDGVPLYQVSHVIGLFSSFNTDFVDQMEFYKSGFPARYGGKLSSVVDVKTLDGDFESYHGSFSLGLIDGRLNIGGPLIKGKTSFNFGLRRSWMDAVTTPAVAYINYKNNKPEPGEQPSDIKEYARMKFAFDDLNFRLTHLFSADSRLTFNYYSGNDGMDVGENDKGTETEEGRKYPVETDYGVDISWGNRAYSLCWDKKFSDKLWLDLKLYRVSSYSDIAFSVYELEDKDYNRTKENNSSKVLDHSVAAGLDWYPLEGHHVRTGVQYQHHLFAPKRSSSYEYYDTDYMDKPQKVKEDYSSGISGDEAAAYAEDEMDLGKRFKINVGVRVPLFMLGKSTEFRLEPRASLKYQATDVSSVRVSYTDMNQFAHLVATSYLDLPTNCWMPSTEAVAPSHSRQLAGGVYTEWPSGYRLVVEGYWKTMDHILEYGGSNSLFPPLSSWESDFYVGKGRSFGLEVEAGYESEKCSFSTGYTLSKTDRLFEDIYYTWYPDRNDNRHKLTLNASWRPTGKLEFYGGWTYHTGSRITAQSHVIVESPDGNLYTEVYESPNNLKLPDYHRLDLGFNFHRTTRRGNEVIWNISIYNAYCRMNPVFGYVDRDYETKRFTGYYTGIIPVIPTFSYTLRF